MSQSAWKKGGQKKVGALKFFCPLILLSKLLTNNTVYYMVQHLYTNWPEKLKSVHGSE
jgi:hypothetical protein